MESEQIREIIDIIADSCKDYVPKVAEYEIHSSTMWVIFWVAAMALSLVAVVATYKYHKRLDEGTQIIIYVVATMILIVGIIGIASQIQDIYIAKYLPEKMFMRYLEKIIENGL